MIVQVGIVELLGSRIAVAFVDPSFIGPGAGDDLLEQISERLRYLTHTPLMLYSNDGRGYAPFQTHEFAKRIRSENMVTWTSIDLEIHWSKYQPEAEL